MYPSPCLSLGKSIVYHRPSSSSPQAKAPVLHEDSIEGSPSSMPTLYHQDDHLHPSASPPHSPPTLKPVSIWAQTDLAMTRFGSREISDIFIHILNGVGSIWLSRDYYLSLKQARLEHRPTGRRPNFDPARLKSYGYFQHSLTFETSSQWPSPPDDASFRERAG